LTFLEEVFCDSPIVLKFCIGKLLNFVELFLELNDWRKKFTINLLVTEILLLRNVVSSIDHGT
jgi:hypothetical protein